MSLRNLVEDQCGAANSLVQLSSHFVQDQGLTDQGLLHPFQHENFQNQNEQTAPFVERPQYNSRHFRMDSILSEMRDLEGTTLVDNASFEETLKSASTAAKSENVSDWANQYIESGSTFAHIEDKPYQSSIWSNEKANDYKISSENMKPLNTNEFDFIANWGHEYLKEPPLQLDAPEINSNLYPLEISELQYVAGQVVNSMNDPQFTDSKFLKFMNQVSDGHVQFSGNDFTGAESSEHTFSKWADSEKPSSISKDTPGVTVDTNTSEKSFSQWGTLPTLLGSNQNENVFDSEKSVDNSAKEELYSKELWSKLTERWEQLNIANQDPWNTEFKNFVASVQSYTFAEENPMADKTNALEEGKKRLEEEDLPSAVLCFEAAVQQNVESVEGWQLLGKTQAENEQDQQAIAALKKCIQLDPNNLEALKELAVCYANENYQYQACYALKEWLARNPKYQDIVEESGNQNESENSFDVTSLLTSKFFNDVLNLYLKAVQRFSDTENADADVQNGLGVLLTLNSDYDKAIDCFETAVKLRPTDSRLWNRLGATLANGQKPEQALEAYRKTLKLSPGFIRARYNLGITCVHLKMYKQAVEHLLVTLNQQVSGRGIHGEKSHAMSESIWTTLKLALALSERKDLLPLAESRDLAALNKEFDVSDVMDGDDVNV